MSRLGWSMRYPTLCSPFKLGEGLVLKNRIVMAPMTRCFAGHDLAPTPGMTACYARRAAAGLIVSEAALINPDSAESGLDNRQFDLAAFGRAFIANSDLAQKIRHAKPLDPYRDSMPGRLF